MFKKTYMMVLENESCVDLLMKLAANNRLHSLYKIGVYGKERQHELYLTGSFMNYCRFKRSLNPKHDKQEVMA